MIKNNYLIQNRQAVKNQIRVMIKNKVSDNEVVKIIAKRYGYKHTTIQTMLSEIKVEDDIE
jgi:hypothetical protein